MQYVFYPILYKIFCALLTYIRQAEYGIITWGDAMENRTEYKNSWKRENRDSYLLTMKKGRKAEIKAAADAKGQSLNSFINDAIDEHMKNPPD